jgi:hypothetical protein
MHHPKMLVVVFTVLSAVVMRSTTSPWMVDARLSSDVQKKEKTTVIDHINNNNNHWRTNQLLSSKSFSSSSLSSSMCERIHPDDLPPECTCSEKVPLGLIISCIKTFNDTSSLLNNDTIGLVLDIDPCNVDGSSVSIDVTEKQHNISYTIAALHAGETKNIPIPGLSIVVPTLGHVGIDVAVLISGNPDSLTLKIGLNACAAVAHKEVCAGQIPGLSSVLPWYILSGTYTFGDMCSTTGGIDRITDIDSDSDGLWVQEQ